MKTTTQKLSRGSHSNPAKGTCAMELAALLAGEPHSDRPKCVCPVIGAFVRNWNDSLDDEARNRILLPIVPKLLNTKSTQEVGNKRAFLALNWLVRVHAPAFLSLVPELQEHAKVLSGLGKLSPESIESAKKDIDAAGDAAWAASGDAAWAASGDAAWVASGAASGAAAMDAAGAAAWTAAWAAAMDAAMDAAGAAAWAASGAATWAAVNGVYLAPTTTMLQVSAVDLLERMIEAK